MQALPFVQGLNHLGKACLNRLTEMPNSGAPIALAVAVCTRFQRFQHTPHAYPHAPYHSTRTCLPVYSGPLRRTLAKKHRLPKQLMLV
ncbi:hypothetical protein PSN_2575 [Pseudomonas sp. NGC7]